jgi:hypothetical protein
MARLSTRLLEKIEKSMHFVVDYNLEGCVGIYKEHEAMFTTDDASRFRTDHGRLSKKGSPQAVVVPETLRSFLTLLTYRNGILFFTIK